MTDGILLNEMTSDFLLRKYSVIIIDEAHERKVNSDLLLGLISRVINLRLQLAKEKMGFPLRLVIMSATLRIDEFLGNKYLFPKEIPVINVESRQFPVQNFFSKKTHEDFVAHAVKKCIKIHRTLPDGDILVFLTGQREIKEFCYLINQKLGENEEKPWKTYPLFSKLKAEDQELIFNKSQEFRYVFIYKL